MEKRAFRRYAGKTYKQHDPLVADGEEGVRKFTAWIAENNPKARGDIKRVFAEGDYVILDSHWTGLFGGTSGEAVVDITMEIWRDDFSARLSRNLTRVWRAVHRSGITRKLI